MSDFSVNAILSAGTTRAADRDPQKIAKAAKEFEAMLLQQMLASARAAGSGDWTGSGEDQTGSPLSEMAEQQFAQVLASNGGIGLAKLVVDGLERKQ